jgi:hypothetical protein
MCGRRNLRTTLAEKDGGYKSSTAQAVVDDVMVIASSRIANSFSDSKRGYLRSLLLLPALGTPSLTSTPVSEGNFLIVTAHAPLSFQEDSKLAFGDALGQDLYFQTIGVKAALN